MTNRSDRTILPRASRRNGSTPATTTRNVGHRTQGFSAARPRTRVGADPGLSLPKSERRIERSSAHRPCVPLQRSADGMIRWSLTDDGRGISAEGEEHVFERFHIGAEDPGGARRGVGLGLPRATAISRAYCGTIDVRSRFRRGSTFTPLVSPAGPAEEA